MNKALSEITSFVGDSMSYLYEGSSNEHLRAGSVYALHLFNEGPGEMEVDGVKYPIERGTLIFLRPGQPHAFHIRPSHPLPSYNLYFDLWDDANPLSPSRSFIHAPEPFIFDRLSIELPCDELDRLPSVFSLRAHPHLYDGIAMIARMYSESKFYRSETVNSFLYGWMLSWHNAVNVQHPSDYRIVRLLEYLNSRPEHGQSVEAWSRFCGLKRTYFHELFLRETGMTPKAYHHQLVMKRAAHMLVETDLSITAIAEKLGYPSIHPFSRHFSSFHGTTPSQYRLNPLHRI